MAGFGRAALARACYAARSGWPKVLVEKVRHHRTFVKLLWGRAMEFGPVAWNVIASVIVAVGGLCSAARFSYGGGQMRSGKGANGWRHPIRYPCGRSRWRPQWGQNEPHQVAGVDEQLPAPGAALLPGAVLFRILAVGYGERSAAMAAAEAGGRDWLEQEGADLLLWGEAGENGRLRLRFLQPEGDGGPAGPYALNAELELPQNFGEDGAVAIAALAATAILQVREGSGETLAPLIEAVLERLRPLAESPPASFGGAVRAELRHAYGAGQLCFARARRPQPVHPRRRLFRKALEEWPRERVPLEWAKAQNNLGTALSALGMRERHGTAPGGGQHLGDALKEWTRKRTPLAWATAYSNLGAVLASLGERGDGDGAERFHQAAEASPRGAQGADAQARAATVGLDPDRPRQRTCGDWRTGR